MSSNAGIPETSTPKSYTHGFRRRIAVGFAFVVALAAGITVVSVFALRSVIVAKDQVISEYAHDLTLTRELELSSEQNASSSRAFLLTGDARYLDKARAARERFEERAQGLKDSSPLPKERLLLNGVVAAAAAHQASLDQAISAERTRGDLRSIADFFEATVQPRRAALQDALGGLVGEKERLLHEAVSRSKVGATDTMVFVASLGGAAAVLASVLFYLSTRTLSRLARAEAEIRDLNENLEKRVRERTGEIEAFAYSVAHDLRAPLRSMSGFSDILLEESAPRLDEAGKEHLRRIAQSAKRMDDLIQGILSLARLSYKTFTMVPVDPSAIVREVVASREGDIRAARGSVEVRASPGRVIGHPSLIALSLDHLVDNALKFVSRDVPPRILIQVQPREATVRISVSDNGIGIPPEYRHRVFRVFERLHPSEGFPGVGVGLAIVRRAVERMGGIVGVQDGPEGGATFWIDLEMAPSAEDKRSLLPGQSPGLSGAH